MGALAARLAGRIVQFREGEAPVVVSMFAYAFLAMAAYNILQPLTRSQFIASLGANNIPYVQLGAGLLIGVIMHGYSRAAARLPRRAVIPTTLGGLAVMVLLFRLLFETGAVWVPVAFYVFGLVIGALLISQFWMLANEIYDARQAKRLFGFIGGGASLGGLAGSAVSNFTAELVGGSNLLLVSAVVLAACALTVIGIMRHEHVERDFAHASSDRALNRGEAFQLLRGSRHLTLIALIIGATAVGAAIIEQQLNMATELAVGPDGTDAVTAFLAQIRMYSSLAGLAIQFGLTSRIHRTLGIGFALLMMPFTLGATGALILISGSLWATSVARILNQSVRYTVDKTTREILFLPLPAQLKYRAKAFVDVSVDRVGRAVAALLLLVLIQPWGLGLGWRELSVASLVVMVLWIGLALVVRREYLAAFRRSLGARQVEPDAVRLDVADASTLEALVEELASDDEARVLYAIDMLEALDKRDLVARLLLHHESPRVRARALDALNTGPDGAFDPAWGSTVERMLHDPDADVRAAAVRALAGTRREGAVALMRPYLGDADPRVVATASVVLAGSGDPGDVAAARAALTRLVDDQRPGAAGGRGAVAAALAPDPPPLLRPLLVSLLHDPDVGVSRTAIRSVARAGIVDPLFVPALVSLLGRRELKAEAREALSGAGATVVEALAHFMHSQDERIWVRRHVPVTLAHIPTQRSMDVLVGALDARDGFLRFKAIEAIERLRRGHPHLTVDREVVERLLVRETAGYFDTVTLRANLRRELAEPVEPLLIRALNDKRARTRDRVFRLLGLLHTWGDIDAARYTIEHGDSRAGASAVEYLDNVLTGDVRKRVMPMLEAGSEEEQARAAYAALRARPRDLEDTLAQLVHDDDPVVAAMAVYLAVGLNLRSLDDDLDFAASRRPRGDWGRDTAAWAVARRATSGADATRPVVVIVDRLRALPLFAFVSVDELFRIAATGRRTIVRRGEVLHVAGECSGSVRFLLEGGVTDDERGSIDAPATLVFDEVLAGQPSGRTLRAGGTCVCLDLDRDAFLAMLSDSVGLAQGLFRTLLGSSASRRRRVGAARTRPAAAMEGPLKPIDVVLALRRSAWLAGADVEQVVALGAIAREVPLQAGTVLFDERGRPSLYHVLDGEVRLEGEGAGPAVARAGDAVGVGETLAGTAFGHRATVEVEGRALRIEHEPLYEVLDEHPDLLESTFSAVLRAGPGEA